MPPLPAREEDPRPPGVELTPREADEPMIAKTLPREQHPISRDLIDPDVLRILYRLKHAGHQAYVVGGAVRDILRGYEPKDFDVATDATPMQLRRLFRNSRIIGRRFKLVHVFFGHKNVEVATLRAHVQPDAETLEDGDLYVHEDNVWGDVESDSWRRDFTINALYYSIDGFEVIDHTGGLDDLEDRQIRSVGDPEVRFREDPVRMLRAIKFAARFGFDVEEGTAEAIAELPIEIHKASRFRVTEEIFRILSQRNRGTGLRMLRDYGFLRHLFPTWVLAIGDEGLEQVIEFFDHVESHAEHGRYLPLEVLAASMFLPMLGTVNISEQSYHQHAGELAQEIRQTATEMDLPKRLTSVAISLLRGQLYLLYFANREKSLNRFVRSPEFDWVWRLHDLAFGDVEELHPLQERWLAAREALPQPLGGWVDNPDRRDVFSFRGIKGGGRHREGEPRTILDESNGDETEGGGRRRKRRRRRRGGRRR